MSGGLDREVLAAQSSLRVRTRPECPGDNVRDSNPNCGIAREKKTENFPTKGSDLKPGPLTERRIEQTPKES